MTYDKLPLPFKAKWVKALREGKWNQTTGTLKKKGDYGYSYCVLGTAAHLLGAKKIDGYE